MYKSNEEIEEEFKKWVDERETIPTSNECKEWFLSKRPESLQAIKEMVEEVKKNYLTLGSKPTDIELGAEYALKGVSQKLDELMK